MTDLRSSIREIVGELYSPAKVEELERLIAVSRDHERSTGSVTSGWRPIDSAPKDGTSILLWSGGEHTIGWWECGKEFALSAAGFNNWCKGHLTVGGYDAGFDGIYNPTHWMPLPAPPSSAEQVEVDRSRDALKSLLHQIEINDYTDPLGHSLKMNVAYAEARAVIGS